jgi:hypothetical protein
LRTKKPPSKGTSITINLDLPSGQGVKLEGQVCDIYGPEEFEGRGPGIDIKLNAMAPGHVVLIEQGLRAAGFGPEHSLTELQDSGASEGPHTIASGPDAVASGPDTVVSAENHDVQPASIPPTAKGTDTVKAGKDTITALKATGKKAAGKAPNDAHAKDTVNAPEGFVEAIAAAGVIDKPEGVTIGGKHITTSDELVRALWQELNGLASQNPFEVLQVALDANDEQIRTAFEARTETFQSEELDQFKSFEVRELRSEITAQLKAAFEKIHDAESRSALRHQIGTVKRDDVPSPAPPAEPERTPTPAPPPEERAESQPANRLALGLSLLQDGQYQEALRILRLEARRDNNVAARAAVELAEGKIALEAGDRMEAAQRFEAALDIDPSNEGAAQEIAEMRRRSAAQRRGVLANLMKKK